MRYDPIRTDAIGSCGDPAPLPPPPSAPLRCRLPPPLRRSSAAAVAASLPPPLPALRHRGRRRRCRVSAALTASLPQPSPPSRRLSAAAAATEAPPPRPQVPMPRKHGAAAAGLEKARTKFHEQILQAVRESHQTSHWECPPPQNASLFPLRLLKRLIIILLKTNVLCNINKVPSSLDDADSTLDQIIPIIAGPARRRRCCALWTSRWCGASSSPAPGSPKTSCWWVFSIRRISQILPQNLPDPPAQSHSSSSRILSQILSQCGASPLLPPGFAKDQLLVDTRPQPRTRSHPRTRPQPGARP